MQYRTTLIVILMIVFFGLFSSCESIPGFNVTTTTTIVINYTHQFSLPIGAEFDLFGASVSLSDNGAVAIIGAPGKDDTGSAYIYNWNGTNWEETNVIASDASSGDYFGQSVSISYNGETAVIGASRQNISKGAVYFFHWDSTNWNEVTNVKNSSFSRFGQNVDISADGETVIVNAPLSTEYGYANYGSAKIYKWDVSNWIFQDAILAYDGAEGDEFATSVAISGNGETILAGAPYHDNGAVSNCGAAYIFTWSGSLWIPEEIIPSDYSEDGEFGSSVSLSTNGKTALIGGDDKTYLYHYNGTNWEEEHVFPQGNGFFSEGEWVSLSADENKAVVSGSLYGHVYEWNGSSWVETLLNKNGSGVSISGDGENILIGQAYETVNGVAAGAAFYFDEW